MGGGPDRYRKIVGWEKWLRFPEGVHLSRESEDLMRRYVLFPFSPSPRFLPRTTPHLQSPVHCPQPPNLVLQPPLPPTHPHPPLLRRRRFRDITAIACAETASVEFEYGYELFPDGGVEGCWVGPGYGFVAYR